MGSGLNFACGRNVGRNSRVREWEIATTGGCVSKAGPGRGVGGHRPGNSVGQRCESFGCETLLCVERIILWSMTVVRKTTRDVDTASFTKSANHLCHKVLCNAALLGIILFMM